MLEGIVKNEEINIGTKGPVVSGDYWLNGLKFGRDTTLTVLDHVRQKRGQSIGWLQ